MRRKTFLREIILALVVGILFATARAGNLFNSLRLRSTDFLHGDVSSGNEIIIVAIDDASVDQYGAWPWSHDIHARLIGKLDQARVIGIDILFDEVGDPVFLDALGESDNVVLAQIGVLSERSAPGIITPQAILTPPTEFIRSAKSTGFVNALPDSDSITRRIPLIIQGKDQVEAAMGLEMLRCCLYQSSALPVMTKYGFINIGPVQIPVDPWGRMTINYVGEPGTFPVFSYVDVLSGAIHPDTFKNKIVFIGQMNLAGGGDLHDVPVSRGKTKMAGVEIQANIIHTILYQRFLVEQSLVTNIAIILLMSVLGGWILMQLRFLWGIPLILVIEGVYLLYAFFTFDRGILPDILFPSLSLGISYVVAIAVDNVTLFRNLRKKHTELIETYDTTLEGWALALDLRDHETQGHTLRVTELTVLLAEEMGIKGEELTYIRRGAILHDIGKIGVPDEILRKASKLTEKEMIIMSQHPTFGWQMLSQINFLKSALPIVYHHHEKWDGTGYPLGLKGNNIPLAARIFAVIDVWDALINERPYRVALSEEEALAIISKDVGTHFDPIVVAAFLKIYRQGNLVLREQVP